MNKNLPLVFFFYMLSFCLLLSSQNWFFLWACMELNSFSFIILMTNAKMMKKDYLVVYFSIQTVSSLMFMLIVMMTENYTPNAFYTPLMVTLVMFLKMGAVPLHNWMLPVTLSIMASTLMLLITIQKILPFLFLKMFSNNYLSLFFMVCWMSVMWGSFQNMNQWYMKNIILFSSISHLGWLLFSMLKISIWEYYFIFYCMISWIMWFLVKKSMKNLNSSNNNIKMFFLFMNLGGLPPFLGFFPKLLLFQLSMMVNILLMIFALIIYSIIDIYVYSRLGMLSLLAKKKYNMWKKKQNWPTMSLILLNSLWLIFLVT